MDNKKDNMTPGATEGTSITQQERLDENDKSVSAIPPQQGVQQIVLKFAESQENAHSSENSEQSHPNKSAKVTDNIPKKIHGLEYIIVTSVKGGCGKSSVSLRTAIELLEEDPKRNVIVIDMDILGTCLERFVDGKKKDDGSLQSEKDIETVDPNLLNGSTYLVSHSEELEDRQKRYFTDLIIKDYAESKDAVVWRDYAVKRIEPGALVGNGENESPDAINKKDSGVVVSNNLHIVFSSPEQEVKNMFQPKNASGYRSVVSIRYYKEVLRRFVQKLNDDPTQGFTHVIFDMPPNSDPYSECIYDILQKDQNVKAEKAGLELRVVSTYDVAHIQANLTWVEDYVHTTSYNNVFPTTIQFVFNQVFDASGEIVKEQKEKIENAPIAPLTERVKKIFPGGVSYNKGSQKTIHIVSEKVIQYKFDPKLALSSALDTPFVITAGTSYRKEDEYTWETGEKKEGMYK